MMNQLIGDPIVSARCESEWKWPHECKLEMEACPLDGDTGGKLRCCTVLSCAVVENVTPRVVRLPGVENNVWGVLTWGPVWSKHANLALSRIGKYKTVAPDPRTAKHCHLVRALRLCVMATVLARSPTLSHRVAVWEWFQHR